MKKTISVIKKSILTAGLMIAMHGCSIVADPTDRYTDVAVFNNPANMRLYIVGMYNEFNTFKFGQFPIGYDNATDALTDVMKYTSSVSGNGTVNILASDASRVNASGPQLNYWNAGYARIRRVNEFLKGLDEYATGLDEATKLKYQAEARFIRGYVYLWLVKLHGSVVLLDKLTTEKDNPRASEDECYNFIAADFAFAAEHLPAQWDASNTGRATKGAANGMLARTWLYAASVAEYDNKQFNQDELTGIPASKAQAYYQNAATAAEKVISSGLYELETDFASIFINKNTKEAIFKIDYARPQLTHQYDLGFAPPKDAPGQVLVYGVPTAELVNEFEMSNGTKFSWQNPAMAAEPYANREPRFYATVLYNGATWKNRTINTTPNDAVEGIAEFGVSTDPKKTVTGYYARKMLDPNIGNIVVNKSAQSWIEMRFAEILLIHAEAKIKLGDYVGAQGSLNALRNKRGLPASTATPNEMMAAIEHERMVELAFEGHRYWDLRRWRKAHITLNNVRFTGHRVTPSGSGFNYETVTVDNANRQFTKDLYYIPIPVDEVLRNNALKQIQGW